MRLGAGTLADESVAERLTGSAVGDREGDQLMDTSQGRVFVFNLEAQRPEMYRALLGDWAADALRALTPDAYMFHTEYVVKAPGEEGEAQTRFGWQYASPTLPTLPSPISPRLPPRRRI